MDFGKRKAAGFGGPRLPVYLAWHISLRKAAWRSCRNREGGSRPYRAGYFYFIIFNIISQAPSRNSGKISFHAYTGRPAGLQDAPVSVPAHRKCRRSGGYARISMCGNLRRCRYGRLGHVSVSAGTYIPPVPPRIIVPGTYGAHTKMPPLRIAVTAA